MPFYCSFYNAHMQIPCHIFVRKHFRFFFFFTRKKQYLRYLLAHTCLHIYLLAVLAHMLSARMFTSFCATCECNAPETRWNLRLRLRKALCQMGPGAESERVFSPPPPDRCGRRQWQARRRLRSTNNCVNLDITHFLTMNIFCKHIRWLVCNWTRCRSKFRNSFVSENFM